MQHLQGELNAEVEEGKTGKGNILESDIPVNMHSHQLAGFLYRKSDEAEGYPMYQMQSACEHVER